MMNILKESNKVRFRKFISQLVLLMSHVMSITFHVSMWKKCMRSWLVAPDQSFDGILMMTYKAIIISLEKLITGGDADRM